MSCRPLGWSPNDCVVKWTAARRYDAVTSSGSPVASDCGRLFRSTAAANDARTIEGALSEPPVTVSADGSVQSPASSGLSPATSWNYRAVPRNDPKIMKQPRRPARFELSSITAQLLLGLCPTFIVYRAVLRSTGARCDNCHSKPMRPSTGRFASSMRDSHPCSSTTGSHHALRYRVRCSGGWRRLRLVS
jgi:hypothetical protein